jgi:hypothetical protein
MARARSEPDPLVEIDLSDPYAKPSFLGAADLCFKSGCQLAAVGISPGGAALDVCAGLNCARL